MDAQHPGAVRKPFAGAASASASSASHVDSPDVETGSSQLSTMDRNFMVGQYEKIIYTFKNLNQFVRDLDERTLPAFVTQLCDANMLCSFSNEDALCIFKTAAEVHGCNVVPHSSQIVTGSLHSDGCSKVISALSRCVIDPMGTEEEKRVTISSLCRPLSDCLMSTNESASSGSAVCVTALIQSNNWQFASDELVNDICLKVSRALEEVHCQTISHLGLVVALSKLNQLTLEPYGRSLIRSGLRILDESTKAGNSQMIISSIEMIHSIMKNLGVRIISCEINKIIHGMELLQDHSMTEIITSVCQVASTTTNLCNQILSWSNLEKQQISTPEDGKLPQANSVGRVKSARKYSDVITIIAEPLSPCSNPEGTNKCSQLYNSMSDGPNPIRRRLTYSEDLSKKHHDLFVCTLDGSAWTRFSEYAKENRDNLTVKISIPRSKVNKTSETTSNELKLIIRRAFQLLKRVHKAGLTFGGQLSSRSFAINSYNTVKLDKTTKEIIKKIEDKDVEENEDHHSFVHMIKREIFYMRTTPTDLLSWLFLVDGCDRSCDELMQHHISLMDEHQNVSTFMSMFDTLREMEKKDIGAYQNVIDELSKNENHSNWQQHVNYTDGNRYLLDTFRYQVDKKKTPYSNNPRGLLGLLRNSRQHSAKFKECLFARIIAEHFPDLLADVQLAMHKEGYLKNLHLRFSMC